MKRLSTRIVALPALITVLGWASPALAQTSFAQAQSGIRTVDLKFQGGTAVDYLDAVRKAADNVNIVVMEDVEQFRMQPVELKRVTLDAAVRLLDGLYQESDQHQIRLMVNVIHSGPDESTLYTVTADFREATRPTVFNSRVWSLTRILQSSVETEDVLTAIETSLDLFGDMYAPAQLRFHKETGLLMARAHPEQIGAIETIVDRLEESVHRPDDRAQLEEFQMEASTRIHRLEEQLAESEDRFITVRREAIEWQTKAELYLGQIETLEGELHAARTALDERTRTLKFEIDRLTRQIEDLKRDGGGRKQQ